MRKWRYIVPVVGGCLPLAAAGQGAAEKPASRPNVLLIYADDVGFGDLSCNGYGSVPTPHVERLAREGIRFTNAHCAASTSTPARYSMLTGEFAWRRPGTGVARGDAAAIIPASCYTMADLFRDCGYRTAVVGKWHLGLGSQTGAQNWNEEVRPNPADLGFGYSYIMAATADRTPCIFMENGRGVNLDPADPVEVSYERNFPGEPTGRDNPELLRMHPSEGHDQSIVNGISRIGYMRGGRSALWRLRRTFFPLLCDQRHSRSPRAASSLRREERTGAARRRDSVVRLERRARSHGAGQSGVGGEYAGDPFERQRSRRGRRLSGRRPRTAGRA